MNNQDKLKELATRPIGRLLWEYSLPAVVGMVVMSLYNVIDRIFIGRGVGADAIAGLAITFPVMNLSAAIGVLIGAGAAARMSIMLGQKDMRGAEKVLGNSVVLTLLNAGVYLTIFGIFIDDILTMFGASPTSLPYARDFMLYILPGMLLTNITYNLNSIMRASGYPTRAMVTMFIGAGCNVILAPIFIFGLGWGIKGAAIATDLSMFIGMLFVLAHFFSHKSVIRFKPKIYSLEWKIVWGVISIGAAPSIVNLAGSLINGIINNSLYSYGGDSAVAAVGILMTYTSLLCTIVVGICQGLQPIIGYNYGAGLLHRLKRVFWLSVAAGSAITVIGGIIGIAFPHWIASAFTIDPQLIAATNNGIPIAMFFFFPVGFQIVSTTLFQSIGKAGKSIFLSLIRQMIFLIPLLLILPPMFGLNGVWAAFPVSDLLATFVSLAMVTWQLRRISQAQNNL